uniref:Uncharacterized protein n=1 Tax=Anopheles darlingi TaxID=43151 RepID=A0A2M4D8W8_ANODA
MYRRFLYGIFIIFLPFLVLPLLWLRITARHDPAPAAALLSTIVPLPLGIRRGDTRFTSYHLLVSSVSHVHDDAGINAQSELLQRSFFTGLAQRLYRTPLPFV